MNCLAIRLEVYASALEVVDIPVGHTFIFGNIDYAFLRLYDPWSSSISLSIKRRQSFYILGLFWVSPLFQFNNPVNQLPSFWFGHHLKRFYFAFLRDRQPRWQQLFWLSPSWELMKIEMVTELSPQAYKLLKGFASSTDFCSPGTDSIKSICVKVEN